MAECIRENISNQSKLQQSQNQDAFGCQIERAVMSICTAKSANLQIVERYWHPNALLCI